MFLCNAQIKLRAVEPEDLEILYKWENNSELWIHGNTLAPYSKLALRQYINDAQQMDIYQSKQLRLMIESTETGVTIGTVDLYDIDAHNRRAGIGILVDEHYRSRSFAGQALGLMSDYAFHFLHIHQLYAYIAVSNKISRSLFDKQGYQYAGLLKEWMQTDEGFEDVEILQLINKDRV